MPESDSELSFAEIAVLKHIANALTGKSIAALLGMSQREVARLSRALCAKTGARNRVQLTRYAISNGYVPVRWQDDIADL